MDEARVQLAARARPALVRRWEERGVAAPYPLRIPSIRLGSGSLDSQNVVLSGMDSFRPLPGTRSSTLSSFLAQVSVFRSIK